MVEFHDLAIDQLEEQLGPAAEDFARDQAQEMGKELEELASDDAEEFADLVEENAQELTSKKDAEFMARVIRNF